MVDLECKNSTVVITTVCDVRQMKVMITYWPNATIFCVTLRFHDSLHFQGKCGGFAFQEGTPSPTLSPHGLNIEYDLKWCHAPLVIGYLDEHVYSVHLRFMFNFIYCIYF